MRNMDLTSAKSSSILLTRLSIVTSDTVELVSIPVDLEVFALLAGEVPIVPKVEIEVLSSCGINLFESVGEDDEAGVLAA